MDAEVLKQFLVQVGFKVDEPGLKKLHTGLAQTQKAVVGFAAAAAAMATAVAVGVAKVARQYEGLYYTSQRVGASAENLKAFRYAIEQIGGSADQAIGAVEALAMFLRTNPAGENLIKSMGVQTRDANGQMRDSVELLQEMVKTWRGMPFYQASARAQVFGIDPGTLQVLMRDSDKFFDDYRRHIKATGVDQDEAAAASARLSQRLREIQAVITLNTDALLLRFMPALETAGRTILQLWNQFQQWLHGSSETRQEVGELFNSVMGLVKAVLELAAAIWRYVGPAVTELAKGALTVLVTTLDTLSHLIKTIAALLRGDWATAWREAKAVAAGMLEALVEAAMTLWKTVKKVWYAVTHKGADMPEEQAAAAPGTGTGSAPSSQPAATAAATGSGGATLTGTPIKQAFDYFRRMGWSDAQSAGIVANLQSESGARLRTDAVGDGGRAFGIAQWHPDRQAAFKRWLGKDIRSSTFAEQLAFVHYELTGGEDVLARKGGRMLRGATTARQAGGIVSRWFERPGRDETARAREEAARGAMAERLFGTRAPLSTSAPAAITQNISQTVTQTISGSDPKSTAALVLNGQGDANGQLVRAMRGVVAQ